MIDTNRRIDNATAIYVPHTAITCYSKNTSQTFKQQSVTKWTIWQTTHPPHPSQIATHLTDSWLKYRVIRLNYGANHTTQTQSQHVAKSATRPNTVTHGANSRKHQIITASESKW